MGNNLRGEAIPEDGLQIANYDENTMINQGTSDWPLPQLTFHQVHGSNIQILRSGRVAKRKESFCKGLAFSNRPIQIDENVCIRFSEVVSNWSGVLRFGVTSVDPETFRDVELPKFACPDLTSKDGYWAKALPERYSVEGSILHFYVNAEGELYYGINGVLKGQFLNGINVFSPLWVIVDIYGNSSSLEFIDPNDVRIRATRSTSGRNRSARIIPQQPQAPAISTSSSQNRTSRSNSSSSSSPALPPSKYHAGVQFSPLSFHSVRGKHVTMTHNYCVAERHTGEFACGYVFTSRPLAFNEKIVIQILDVEPAYTGSMAFGLTCCDPITLQASLLPVDSDDLLERGEYWVGIKDIGAQPKATDELSFWITDKGEVYFAKNNLAPRIIIYVDVAVKLWAYFDVYGTTQRIRILGAVKTRSSSPFSPRVPPLPNNCRYGRSLLDLPGQSSMDPSPERPPVAQRPSASELPAVRSVSTTQAPRLTTVEEPQPLSRRSQSELNTDAFFLRLPTSTPNDRRSVAPAVPAPANRTGVQDSADAVMEILESIRATRPASGTELPISPRSLIPPPVPARASPSRAAPARPTSFPPPRPPPAQHSSATSKHRSVDEEVDDGDECKICMSAKVNSVIYTCGHMSMCFECATETWRVNGECPICRKKIEDVIKIYKS